jgi:hypothetical protein
MVPLQDRQYLASCLQRMHMEAGLADHFLLVLDAASAKAPLPLKLQAERLRRLDALPQLAASSGAAHVFWQTAQAAIAAAHSPEEVNWSEVERSSITQSIGVLGQTPTSVADALCTHCPGAVYSARQAAICALVERLSPALLAVVATNAATDSAQAGPAAS